MSMKDSNVTSGAVRGVGNGVGDVGSAVGCPNFYFVFCILIFFKKSSSIITTQGFLQHRI